MIFVAEKAPRSPSRLVTPPPLVGFRFFRCINKIPTVKIIRDGDLGADVAAFCRKNGLFGRDPGGRQDLAIYKGAGVIEPAPGSELDKYAWLWFAVALTQGDCGAVGWG